MESAELGRMQHPVRGLLHGSAAVVSFVGITALLDNTRGLRMTVAITIYGAALVSMFMTSTLYHSVPWKPLWKARFQKLDHTFIYVLVAGTFTPLVLGAVHGAWMILGLVSVWGLVALGIARELAPGRARKVWTPLQIIAVCLVLGPMWITLVAMEPIAAILTVAGGAAYLMGTLLFVNNRPRLIPPLFSHHEFFHVVVVAASLIHFVAVWRVISAL